MSAGTIDTPTTLPNLQTEIEALHAELLGGTGLEAAAIVTELTGRAEAVTPDALRVLEGVLGGRFAEQMAKVWSGDYADFDGDESSAEWALAKEAVYHAMQLGYAGDALALVVEQLLRAGPYRPKWDSPRTVTLPDKRTVKTTWLGMTIGRAIKARERKAPAVVEEPAAPAAASETPAQTIARLKRELAQERAAGAVRQTVIRAQRAELAELQAERAALLEAIANPDLRGNEFRVFVVAAVKAHTQLDLRADVAARDPDGGVDTAVASVSLAAIAGGSGVSVDTAGKAFRGMACAAEAPFEYRVTRELRRDDAGAEQWVSIPTLKPRAARLSETLTAVANYHPIRSKHGGARERACRAHPTADVIITTTWRCSICQAVLDQHSTPTPPLKPQVAVSEDSQQPVDRPGISTPQVAVSERSAPAAGLNGHHAVSANGNGSDQEAGHFDQRAAALVAIPPGGDRTDGDYGRWAPTLEERAPALRFRFKAKTASNGHAPTNGNGTAAAANAPPVATTAPPGRCTCDEVSVHQAGDRWLCSGCGLVALTVANGGQP